MDGAPVSIPGAKPRALLTMLGLHSGSVVPADVLMELLWGDDPPRTAAKALQTHISSLRHALGDGFVLTEGTGWRLGAAEVDAPRYQSLARSGRDALTDGDTSGAVARFEEAVTLWRGIPELPDGRRGVSEKTRWVEGHAAVVEDRADALLATGRAAEIIGDLEAAVADAPLRERRWGQLMLALYRAGRQGEALGAFRRARTLLAAELGVDPGPDLRRLEAAIVAQDSELDIPATQHVPSVTRAVTFLLTDIEGSTVAWEADAAAMAVALARHDELVEQVVTSRGGRLIKTRGEGDATFSVFDRPSAAAAAAIELQDAIFHEPWALTDPMRIRVALHTGEAELRDGDYFGRAVNRAARLRSLASGGQILCSGATAELVIDSLSDDVTLVDLGMRQLKNLTRPEHVFELRPQIDENPPPTGDTPIERPMMPAVLGGPGPFVGRSHELAELVAAWQSALTGGTRAVLIAGEPGVGKTRLAGEWGRQAYEQGAVVLYGRSDEDLGAPYQPFAEALRTLVPCISRERLRGMRGVEALLPLVPGLTDVLPDLTPSPHGDPDTERYALFDAVVALLGIASVDVPIVLVLDDLHWAAKPTLLLLRHLLRFGEHARVQIIGTYRSTDLDRSHPLAAMLADLHRDGSANRIALGGLDEGDVSAYVTEAGYDDEELARALASVTGGNPFFLIEALRHVDESGGHWDPSTLPQGVREAVSRRLSRLPVETNKALAAAAVVGSQFSLDLVEQVVGQDLVDAFDGACQAGIVIEEPGGIYRFNHAIVRQSLLAELASVRRMRLHQRIATTLETLPGASDELLAELAHHYFECAWAGNALKAVEYCRRAADQAMARLAYEGAADLYDHALHALDELDDELPDRDDQRVELLVARCEALLAAGDVSSAASAVSQLKEGTRDSARLAAWATCFDSQLSMLVDPERLDEIEIAVRAAAETLAELGDAAGEAKAHTVRAGCLARLGRVADCELALDNALTAARQARDHRLVNAVLAGAPLAALWGPNPVPRAGGRCLDVVRLLRITTDSPAVEATSTRCQAVLEAFRGRAAAARRMIDSAGRTVTELGLRHALLEVDHFAGIVELVLGDAAAAELHLRLAYNGFRRMGLDADTAEAAALLARACLLLDRDVEADELCSESERLAGHALKASIAWRTVRAQLLSRGGTHSEARRVAEEAVAIAERTDALVDHGDACLTLATVLGAAGDVAGARAAAERAADLYERKGAVALTEKARRTLGGVRVPAALPESPAAKLDNECVRAVIRLGDAADREAWDEAEQLFASVVSAESHRKIVGYPQIDLSFVEYSRQMSYFLETGMVRYRWIPVAIRGERLALTRLTVGTADSSSGAPQDEFLQVVGLNREGLVSLQVSFDLDDIDAAIAELDAQHARFEALRRIPKGQVSQRYLDTDCTRASERAVAAIEAAEWDEFEQMFAPEGYIESRRKLVGFKPTEFSAHDVMHQTRCDLENGNMRANHAIVAVRGERLALARVSLGTVDESPGAPQDELLQVFGIDEYGRITLQIWFDVDDMDAALAELDVQYTRFEEEHPRASLENVASRVDHQFNALFSEQRWDEIAELLADSTRVEDRRRGLRREATYDRVTGIAEIRSIADLGVTRITSDVIATRGTRLALVRARYAGRDLRPDAFHTDVLRIGEVDTDGRCVASVAFDIDEFDAAITELDARYLAGEAAHYKRVWSLIARAYDGFNQGETPAVTRDWVNIDHRHAAAMAPGEGDAYFQVSWELAADLHVYIEEVQQLSALGAVVTQVSHGTSRDGFDAEWREINIMMFEGELISHCELFDESDLDAALARFDELSRPAQRLENAASRAYERMKDCFSKREWTAFTEILDQDISNDDRRRVVNAGVQRGQEAVMAEISGIADVGVTSWTSHTVATRGERVVLHRARAASNELPQAFGTDLLDVVEINADGRVVARVAFDPEDLDAALAELDKRYLAGEAASHAHTWSVITRALAAFNRREVPEFTPDWANIDHRRARGFAPGDLTAYTRATWDLAPDVSIYAEAVLRLSRLGAVFTQAVSGTSQDGFIAEWREICLANVEGNFLSRIEMFDEGDLDAALARFDELSEPAPQRTNAATRTYERFQKYLADSDLDAIATMLTDDFCGDDRRRVVGSGIRHGQDAALKDGRAITDLGVRNTATAVIATRGEHLALRRSQYSLDNEQAGAFDVSVLEVVALDTDERISAVVTFDPDDLGAAMAELDARYLAGEAAAHFQTWSAITGAYAALNRRELPPTTASHVSLDHRRVTSFAPGEIKDCTRVAWNQIPDISFRIEAVHQLNDFGAVVTHALRGTSRDGFEAEWRELHLITFESGLFSRSEIFDETDLDTALARFDEFSRPALRLSNTASQVFQRIHRAYSANDWETVSKLLAEDAVIDDRRPFVGAGARRGREAVIANGRAVADVGMGTDEMTVIATRGKRLALMRVRVSEPGDGQDRFNIDAYQIVEIDWNESVLAIVVFDLDEIDAAFADLNGRYLAGEAAAHARTWCAITEGYAAFNRREIPPTTPDWVNIDHRRARAFTPGNLIPYIRATWDLTPQATVYVDAVHRLSDLGAVVGQVTRGTSNEGFDFEWREIALFTVDDGLIDRIEVFDEADLDAALARFEELHSRPVLLKNAASQSYERFNDCFTARDWAALANTMADDFLTDDRRRLLGSGEQHGREAAVAHARAVAAVGVRNAFSTVVATRGERLALIRARFWGHDDRPDAFSAEVLHAVEVGSDSRIASFVAFDLDDIDAALEELETRYLAGEAAPHAHTWSLVTEAYAALNRRELPLTTEDFADIDHRRGARIDAGGMKALLRSAFEHTPVFSSYVESVHRLTEYGSVITQVAHGTSDEGFDAEWRNIGLLTVEGNLINRCEVFDESDLDAALARLQELQPQPKRQINTASLVEDRSLKCFAARDWSSMRLLLADEFAFDDRRSVVNAGTRRGPHAAIADAQAVSELGGTRITSDVIATRGECLFLARTHMWSRYQELDAFHTESLCVVGIDTGGQLCARVVFDPDDLDAAFAELDARYLAGEAAAHAHTWSAITRAYATLNHHELPETTPDWVNIDHRRGRSWAPGDMIPYVHATWDVTPDLSYYAAAVHALSDVGAIVTRAAQGTSQEGLYAEWREIALLMFEGDLISHCEMFDESDLDTALARFDELSEQPPT